MEDALVPPPPHRILKQTRHTHIHTRLKHTFLTYETHTYTHTCVHTQVAWNPQFQVAAVCSFASWAPVLLAAYDSRLPDVALTLGHKNGMELMGREHRTVRGRLGAGGRVAKM